MSTLINFEMREYTRPATDEERAEQLANLLATMNAIDTTRSEAKTKAAEFKAQISNLEDREDDLRQHLEAGTFLEGVEVHAVIDEMSGNTEYYDRAGNLIPQLTHPTTKQERRDEAERRQMKMFSGEQGNPSDNKTPFDIAPLSQADADRADYEKRMEDLANTLGDLSSTSPYGNAIDAFEAGVSNHSNREQASNSQTHDDSNSNEGVDFDNNSGRSDDEAVNFSSQTDDWPTLGELLEKANVDEAQILAEIQETPDEEAVDPANLDQLDSDQPTQLESAASTMQPEPSTLATTSVELPKRNAARSESSTAQPPARKNGRFAKRETA